MIAIASILDQLANREDLRADQAKEAFQALFAGELTPAQAGALLMGLRSKGETAVELGAAVAAGLEQARLVPGLSGKRIDTCGTGGDNTCSFNCSTAVSLTLAGMGYTVVKHGNRAVSSSCGSADVLEALGLPIGLDPIGIVQEIKQRHFAFLFAPNFHPAFKNIMPVRKDLGCRTIFNLMGPLLNPARPTHQILGVPNPKIMRLMAEALCLSGLERAAVVHGAGGFDELTPFGPAKVVWVRTGHIEEAEIDPKQIGIDGHSPSEVTVTGKDHAVSVMRELLSGKGPKAMQDMIVFNLAVALHLLEPQLPIKEAVIKAREALSQGAGGRVLDA